jgi:adenylate cyclase class 2
MALSLDEVEHLGAFIKIERVVPPRHSGAAVRADLDAFAGSLGVPLERTTETYDSLVHAALAGV